MLHCYPTLRAYFGERKKRTWALLLPEDLLARRRRPQPPWAQLSRPWTSTTSAAMAECDQAWCGRSCSARAAKRGVADPARRRFLRGAAAEEARSEAELVGMTKCDTVDPTGPGMAKCDAVGRGGAQGGRCRLGEEEGGAKGGSGAMIVAGRVNITLCERGLVEGMHRCGKNQGQFWSLTAFSCC
jgi:hypothetical protein